MKRIVIILLTTMLCLNGQANQRKEIKGRIQDAVTKKVLPGAAIIISGTNTGTATDADGYFTLSVFFRDKHTRHIHISYLGYKSQQIALSKAERYKELLIELEPDVQLMSQVEVFGERYRQPEKMDFITRMPLRPGEQIQSISVVSDKLIAQQSTQTLADAARNVAGISTFSTFGGASESLSARGFRGVPVLKNGVRIHSDFRGGGTLTEMQGIESIQVIKGSVSITQGIGNDLASAGGVINIATKTPKFINSGEVSLGTGSWGKFRPAFDMQQVVGKQEKLAFRLNGVYDRSGNFRKYVTKDRVYFNPSVTWRPDNNTSVTLEYDYLHDSRTPDRGTVNLSAMDEENLYDMPHSKFLGFKTDRVYTNQQTYALRFERGLSDKLSFRIATTGAELDTDNTGGSTSVLRNVPATGDYNILGRSIGRSQRNDKNKLVQVDLIGKDVMTGLVKHTFQVGIDYRYTKVKSTSYNSVVVDTIDVLSVIPNDLPAHIKLNPNTPEISRAYSYGIMAQDVITLTPFLKTVLGVRYSCQDSNTDTSSGSVTGDTFNPMVGVIISPWKNVHIFGSYTNTTDLRSASNLMEDGSAVGKSVITQFESGVKSEWFNQRLRTNLTVFRVLNDNLAYVIYDDAGQSTNRYGKAGDLRRKGVELEITGRILPSLQTIIGYAYLDAEYRDSPAYMNGSAPMNAPKHTANGWLYYTFDRGVFRGLSVGTGTYYVGQRPVNDYTVKYTHAGTTPGLKPFDMAAYTTVNVSVGYDWKRFALNLVFNNILNESGYSSYARGGYINPVDPFNFSARLNYKF